VSDIDTAVVDSLKALDPEWPIREATSRLEGALSAYDPKQTDQSYPAANIAKPKLLLELSPRRSSYGAFKSLKNRSVLANRLIDIL
jgi:hypothetical protein